MKNSTPAATKAAENQTTAVYRVYLETEKAVKISAEVFDLEAHVPVWLPKSQITIKPYPADPGCKVITAPNWLLDAKLRELRSRYKADVALDCFDHNI